MSSATVSAGVWIVDQGTHRWLRVPNLISKDITPALELRGETENLQPEQRAGRSKEAGEHADDLIDIDIILGIALDCALVDG